MRIIPTIHIIVHTIKNITTINHTNTTLIHAILRATIIVINRAIKVSTASLI